MDVSELSRYIVGTYAGVRTAEANGDTFFWYDPDGDLPPERQQPFATVVTGDHYDTVSDLDRREAYRINIGLTRATYAALIGPDLVVDHAAEDVVMPHPTYAGQHWVGVVNPGAATVRELLDEAYAFAVRKFENHRAGQARKGRPA